MLKTTQSLYSKNIFVKLFVFCSILLFSINSYANENNKTEIKYGYPNQSIFIANVNGKEQPITPMLLVAEELFKKAGIPWKATAYPAKRLFQNLKSGETNFTILVRASSLVDKFIFSKEPIYSTDLNIYYIGDKTPITKKEDLSGKKLVTIRGYSYGSLRKFLNNEENKISKEATNTHSSAFEMLKLGRVDYWLDYASAAKDIIKEGNVEDVRTNKMSQLDIFLVLSKSYPNAQEVMEKLEKILETMDINEIIKSSVK